MPGSPTRHQIAKHLAKHGPVEDPKGRATSKLMDSLGYSGPPSNFAQLICNMNRAGMLTTEVRGKRTYRIAVVDDPASCSDESDDMTQQADMDYDGLASALLVQVVQKLTESPSNEKDTLWARRRIDRLERRVNELERELSKAHADVKLIAADRDELRIQLEHSDGNLALLAERLGSGQPAKSHLSEILNADERALLAKLNRDLNRKRGTRAS